MSTTPLLPTERLFQFDDCFFLKSSVEPSGTARETMENPASWFRCLQILANPKKQCEPPAETLRCPLDIASPKKVRRDYPKKGKFFQIVAFC